MLRWAFFTTSVVTIGPLELFLLSKLANEPIRLDAPQTSLRCLLQEKGTLGTREDASQIFANADSDYQDPMRDRKR